jgi:putative toxin-antitoxin system antitoxin component (TIGR02293 family)
MAYASYVPTTSRNNHPVARVLGLKARNLVDLTTQIEKGLPTKSLETMGNLLELSQPHLADLMGISVRTLQRSKQTLSPAVSDHLYRLGNLLETAMRFHGNREAAVLWLKNPNIALGGVAPLKYARTEAGSQAILDLLGGLEHGVVQ